jgi:hypothetical protein
VYLPLGGGFEGDPVAYGGERGHVMAQPWFSSAAGGEVVEVAKAAGSIGQQVCADTASTRSAGSPTATPPAQRGNCGRSAVARPRRPARRAWSSGLAHGRSTAAEDGAPITKRDAAEPVRYQPRRSATSAANSRPHRNHPADPLSSDIGQDLHRRAGDGRLARCPDPRRCRNR